ncbi:MAG: 16S rRNA (cytosine(1402)-N(4))-methyltransferase RsmH [Bacteroidota bacterium]
MYHIPALLNESIEGLAIKPNGVYIDVTFGGGGHSKAILNRLNRGQLIAFDRDEDTLNNAIQDERFLLIHSNYRHITSYLKFFNSFPVDGILADLGVSSHQFDTDSRGFSARFHARLDGRMSQSSDKTAWDVINYYEEVNLIKLFREYGEINNSKKFTSKIISERNKKSIDTTTELFEIVKPLAEKGKENKYMAQIMQSLRIEVNNEINELALFLQQVPSLLKPKGRFVVISYHSLEDRLVKNILKSGNLNGDIEKDFFGNVKTIFNSITRKPIVPSENELNQNSRARSAKLRIAEMN